MALHQYENVGSFIRECANKTLRYDEACLRLITNAPITFWSQYTECEGCDLQETVKTDYDKDILVRTLWPLRYEVRGYEGFVRICNGTYQFGEFGQYELNLTDIMKNECLPKMTAQPDAAYLPILSTIVTLLAMATFWYIVKGIGKRVIAGQFYSRYFAREDNELGSETRILTSETNMPRSPTRSRLRSLDIFRGAAIAMMIFVNAGGGGYAVFQHSVWNGLTVADVVFPCFAFAMGEALVLSLNARLRTAMSRMTALAQVARRSLLMGVIGVLLGSANADWNNFRLPGVLQRLAAMYFIVGAIECATINVSQNIRSGMSLIRDITNGWKQWTATLILVVIQVCVSLCVADPGGCPVGYSGPGGLHLSSIYGSRLENCTGGITGYIDRTVFGTSHLYKGGTFRQLYQAKAGFDPEGLLGCLSGVLVVQAGAHATRIMLLYNHARARMMRWLLWSVVFGVAGGALCGFSRDGGPIPINKNLWSLSYCLVTASIGFFIQAVLFFFVDLKNKWGGRPLYYAGQNALFIYVGSELLKRHFPLYWPMHAPTHTQLLITHAATTLIWLAVGVALHRKRIFITI